MSRAPLHTHTVDGSVGDRTRLQTVECMFEHDDGAEVPLVEFLAQLQDVLNDIPEEHRSAAVVLLRAYGDYASADMAVQFKRPETDQEMNSRFAWLDGLRSENEERDRREYERLKGKYESGTP